MYENMHDTKQTADAGCYTARGGREKMRGRLQGDGDRDEGDEDGTVGEDGAENFLWHVDDIGCVQDLEVLRFQRR